MAVPILRLNIDDNPRIIVKQDNPTIIVTGYTNTWGSITGTLSGQTDLWNELTGMTADIQAAQACCTGLTETFNTYTGDTFITLSGLTWAGILLQAQVNGLENAFESHTGDTTIHFPFSDVTDAIASATSGITATSAWSGLTGLPSDNSDLVDYVALEISGATSGLTSSWNEITDKPAWLSGTTLQAFQTGHTHSYNNLTDLPSLFSGDYDDLTNKPDLSIYLTGYTVTADDVTGITASLYAPVVHTHTYSAITDTPDLSVYQPVSGMSVYLTGVTWNDVTNKPDLTLQSDFTGHTSDLTIHYPQSGISITESQISDLQAYALQSAFDTYTGTTAPASFLSITGLTGYWTSAQTENYVTGYTPTLEWGNITGTISGQTDLWSYLSGGTGGGTWGTITGNITGQTDLWDALNQKVDYPVYYDDLQTIGDKFDAFDSQFTSINNVFNTHTGNTTIHFLQSAISITESQISDLQDYALDSVVDNELEYKVDWVLYQDDLQILSNEIDALISGQTALSLLHPTIINLTGSTTGDTSWDGAIIEMDSTGNTTLTLPNGLSAGATIRIYNVNTGDVTIAAEGTLQGVGTILATQYTKAEAYNRGGDVWLITGTLTS